MADESPVRVRFQDVKPYDAPENLDELHGPASGTVDLPPWVYWGPRPQFDLSREGERIVVYQAAIQEGRAVDQAEILNRDLLIAIWQHLSLPARARQLWEGRFPELVALT